jgi:hypothetical protein
VAPFDLVKDGPVFVDQGGVEEEPLGKGRLDASNGFPVGWAEVSSKRKAYLEEQVVCKDVREHTCDIRMMLDLADARLDVIGVDDDVVVGV